MKYLLISILILFSNLQSLDLDQVRIAYKEAAQNPEKVDDFFNSMQSVTRTEDMELVAYKGAAIALKARNAKTLKDKKTGFIEGVSYIEFAIETEPNNIESRFIRLGIQENTPKLLKYKADIDRDKAFILTQLPYIKSTQLKNHIKDYILHSDSFTSEEKSVFSGR
ncbi:hypothetical protein BZARG_2026 [Bizionia argentinensis JUB59]|uniref:Uncharacterized protein n=1 Tax=Bizionia argentinensis JUB59 TaxID=1046627 RepID=G2EF92_9FLAO|nr:hypothetical protein [Bizionia argentinensis]EGV42884.2 hypothetical protein BZARG_2026 [Bizionia argentinensis JUB59]